MLANGCLINHNKRLCVSVWILGQVSQWLEHHYNDDLYHIHHFHYAATEDMVKFS